MPNDERPRVRKVTTLVSFTAGATPATLHTLSTGRTAVIRKIMAFSGQAANVTLEIGTGLAGLFARTLPRITLIPALDYELGELDCPSFEFQANITGQVSAAGGGALAVEVMLEVEEVG